MKIIRPFTGAGGIFFPIGEPPEGTCEFATDKCKKFCYIKENPNPDFDEEIIISFDDTLLIYDYFMNAPLLDLCDRIEKELDGLQTNILHWFGSGDCQIKDIERILKIIDHLRLSKNIVQMGFTRNETIWMNNKDIFVLTVDDKQDIKGRIGRFSIPKYEEQISVIYSSDHIVKGGFCGPTTCRDQHKEELEHYINCATCRRMKVGCFSRRMSG